jgi:hypothetical protein
MRRRAGRHLPGADQSGVTTPPPITDGTRVPWPAVARPATNGGESRDRQPAATIHNTTKVANVSGYGNR